MWSHLKRKIIAGFFIILPLIVTILLLTYIFDKVNRYITPYVFKLFKLLKIGIQSDQLTTIALGIIGFIFTIFIIYVIGLLGTNIIGKRLITAFDNIMLRVPLIKGIYGGARQLMQALSVDKMAGFERVVLIQYPRKGIYALGFATSETAEGIEKNIQQELMNIFIPTSPFPASGMLILVPRKDVIFIDISLEDAFKLIVSGGIVMPEGKKKQQLIPDLVIRNDKKK
jgi:uncharacterized membrane protein